MRSKPGANEPELRTLSREDALAWMGALVAIGGDVDDWAPENFLLELPEKWTLSFAAFTPAPVAYAIVSRRGPGHLHLHHLMVARERRGSGLGSRMVGEVVRRAGSERLTLKVHAGNRAAIGFYERNGLQVTDDRSQYWWLERSS